MTTLPREAPYVMVMCEHSVCRIRQVVRKSIPPMSITLFCAQIDDFSSPFACRTPGIRLVACFGGRPYQPCIYTLMHDDPGGSTLCEGQYDSWHFWDEHCWKITGRVQFSRWICQMRIQTLLSRSMSFQDTY